MEREEEIRKIAYQIWEQEGYVNGRDFDHWSRAEQIWESARPQKTATLTRNPTSKSIFGKKKSK